MDRKIKEFNQSDIIWKKNKQKQNKAGRNNRMNTKENEILKLKLFNFQKIKF